MRLVLAIAVLALVGCLKFGENIELSGASFTQKEIDRISLLTGLKFPPGAIGLNYYYHGDGIDPALAAKLSIPTERLAELMTNTIFDAGRNEVPRMEIARKFPWWSPSTLTGRIDRTHNLPSGRYMEISLGEEGGQIILYLSWMSS